ncbi:MAG: hypothetical protein N2654_03155 [Deltaproteobacteria bacterium]|nr:hypothetical protein [Deltaproteobacteria bacterium]
MCYFIDSSKSTKIFEKWKDVSLKLRSDGFNVILLGKERIFCEPEVGINLTGLTTLEDVMYLANKSNGVISNDSFGAHLAMGYRKPLVVFFCSTSDWHNFFNSKLVLKVFPPKLACWPCSKGGRQCCPVGDFLCVKYEPDIYSIVKFLRANGVSNSE